MTRPRSTLIQLESTPYYHCISRCVRRAFLCGKDRYTGRSFDHRKPWLVKRIKFLSALFAIDIAAYAIMSNHYHLVLHVDKTRSQNWSTREVVTRWLKLYKGPGIALRYQQDLTLNKAEYTLLMNLVKTWRERLCSISWFMACLNQHIARLANKEDHCTGRFWEGRFKSQALLDESALLSCMAYVDLNPIRAGLAKNLQSSSFTSIQQRIKTIKKQKTTNSLPLMIFSENINKTQHDNTLAYNLKDYIDLVDWTGRSIRHDKRGHIHKNQPKLLNELGLSDQQWLSLSLEIQKQSISILNGMEKLKCLETKKEKVKYFVA